MKLNNKGFTLIEVLAVVVILMSLTILTFTSIGSIMNKNKNDNYNKLKESILNATKIYLSDNRYSIVVENPDTCEEGKERDVLSINNTELNPKSKIPISILVAEGNIKTQENGDIINPRDKTKKLNQETSYVIVKYSCNKKDYIYSLEDSFLEFS